MNLFDLCVYKNLNKGSGGDVDVSSLVATENKTYNAGTGKAYNPVVVNVPTPSPSLQSLTASHNGYFVPSSGYDGFSEVTVDVATPLETLSATENGTYIPSSGYEGFSEVTVDVPLPNNAYLLESQKDDVVTIQHGAEFDMPKLIASIEPQQSGSGDPSPENVRPISGWNKCKVSVVGKNKVNPDTLEIGYYNNNGEKINDDHYRTSALISAKSNTVYTTSLFVKDTKEYVGGLVTTCWDVNENIINQYTSSSFTTPPNTAYIRVRNFQSDTSHIMNDNFIYQLEEGSTATEYEPYNGNTYTINFVDGSSPLIVYGGTLNVLTGLLTVDRAYVNMGDLSWTKPSNYTKIFYAQPSNVKIGVSGQIQTICSQYPSVACNDFSTLDTYYDKVVTIQKNASSIVAVDSGYSSASDFKTAMNGVQLVYELATPQTYQLTPTEVKSLLGVNNIFADTGEVDVQIWTKEVTS